MLELRVWLERMSANKHVQFSGCRHTADDGIHGGTLLVSLDAVIKFNVIRAQRPRIRCGGKSDGAEEACHENEWYEKCLSRQPLSGTFASISESGG